MDQPWVYIVLFGLVLIVYAKVLPNANKPSRVESSGDVLSGMEEAMDHFAAELEEQNQALIQMFGETKKEFELHTAKLTARVESLEAQNRQVQAEIHRLSFHAEQRQAAASDNKLSAPATALELPPARQGDVPAASVSGGQAKALEAAVESEVVEPAPAPSVMNIKERYAELFQLYEQGKSTDVIAKKLGMNKGEINLILQLAKQEARSHA